MAITKLQMNLFTSLFKGREDVFAKRWETKDKSGYAPAKDIDWNQYSLHKAYRLGIALTLPKRNAGKQL